MVIVFVAHANAKVHGLVPSVRRHAKDVRFLGELRRPTVFQLLSPEVDPNRQKGPKFCSFGKRTRTLGLTENFKISLRNYRSFWLASPGLLEGSRQKLYGVTPSPLAIPLPSFVQIRPVSRKIYAKMSFSLITTWARPYVGAQSTLGRGETFLPENICMKNNKMPEFYDFCQKNIFPEFPPSPTPMGAPT